VSAQALQRKDNELFLCVSLNPAIDKRLTLPRFEPGSVNRAASVKSAPGGKAAHVAMVLRVLGAEVAWVGFHGGPEGAVLIEGLKHLDIQAQGVLISAHTRTNLEIIDAHGLVTELLEPGPTVTSTEITNLQSECEKVLCEARQPGALILSGSLPLGAPADAYARFTELGHRHGWRVFLDSSGEPLRHALKAHPDFVKSNQHEASELADIQVDAITNVGAALEKMIEAGAGSVAISMGAKGMAWKTDANSPPIYSAAPSVNVVSAVGSGDAALAGFAYASNLGLDAIAALQLAVACGAANCLAPLPGQPNKNDIDRLRAGVAVMTLESAVTERSLRPC
jgi:1-phosphofructokinase family hexose kinase